MYRTTYKCDDCKKSFTEETEDFPQDDPSCPFCAKAKKEKRRGVSMRSSVSDKTHKMTKKEQMDRLLAPTSPRQIYRGKSNFSKAMDMTAEIVMQDNNMTNLRDNQKEGDSMVPALPAHLEKNVQNAWGGNRMNAPVNMGMVSSGMFRDQGDIVRSMTSVVTPRPIKYIE